MANRAPTDLTALIEATPVGQQLWLRGAGRSLYPLLRSGDSVRVLRCEPEALARGDVALVRVGRRLIAHVVLSTGPVVTASLLGRTGVVVNPALAGEVGRASVDDGGAGLVLQISASDSHPLRRGDRIVLIEYLDGQNAYRVVPEQQFLGR